MDSFIEASEEQEKLIENLTSERDKLSEEKSKWIEDKAKLEEELQRFRESRHYPSRQPV